MDKTWKVSDGQLRIDWQNNVHRFIAVMRAQRITFRVGIVGGSKDDDLIGTFWLKTAALEKLSIEKQLKEIPQLVEHVYRHLKFNQVSAFEMLSYPEVYKEVMKELI